MRKMILGVTVAAMALAGCDSTPADLHGLSADPVERATACGRAAVAYTASAGEDAAESKRRADLLQSIVDATDFFGVTGLDDAKGKELLGDIEATLREGNWLGTVNACKAAYDLGPPETLPTLPQEPEKRASACAGTAFARSLATGELDDEKIGARVLADPKSSYFLIEAARSSGDISAISEKLGPDVEWAVASGAVGPLTDECVKEFPKASLDSVELPADEGNAVLACALVGGLYGDAEGDLGAKAKAMLGAVEKSTATPDLAIANDPKALISMVADIGSPVRVAEACFKRFPG
ncbi:MAG: hypothetical protein R3E02_06790 [Blastomonas sp.]